jgi:hypothetical protein
MASSLRSTNQRAAVLQRLRLHRSLGGEYGIRGRLTAFDAKTGKFVYVVMRVRRHLLARSREAAPRQNAEQAQR